MWFFYAKSLELENLLGPNVYLQAGWSNDSAYAFCLCQGGKKVFPTLLSHQEQIERLKGLGWRRKWQPTAVFLLGKSHEQRSLLGYSPWGPKESDTT